MGGVALRIEILVRKTQTNLKGLEDLLASFFEFRRIARRWHESLEGVELPSPGGEAMAGRGFLHIDVPWAEMKRKNPLTRWLSRYSWSFYRLRLTNVGRNTLLAILAELERHGLEVGFVERATARTGLSSGFGREVFMWPKEADSRRSTFLRLYDAYRKTEKAPLIDLDFFTLSLRAIMRRKLRTAFLVAVLSLVCANFIYYVRFSIGGEGVTVIVPRQWELPLAAGLMALITFLNLMEISFHERKMEIGTIRALGAETTTTIMIFAAEGMILGTLGAMAGYFIVLVASLIVKFSGINPALDLVVVAGPGKAILGFFLGLVIGLLGSVPPIIPMIWRPPEECL